MGQLNKVGIWKHQDGKLSATYFDERDMVKYGYKDEDEFIEWYMGRLVPCYPGSTSRIILKSNLPNDSDVDTWSDDGVSVSVDFAKVKSKIRSQFNENKCKQDFYQVFSQSISTLAPYWGALSDMISFKNFEGIKAFADGLLSTGVLTSNQYDSINQIFKSQNIDLDNL